MRTIRLAAAAIATAALVLGATGVGSAAVPKTTSVAAAASDIRVESAAVHGNTDGTVTLTAAITRNNTSPQILVLKLNHAATVTVYNLAANAALLQAGCSKIIPDAAICEVIGLLAAPIEALGPPPADACLGFWAVLAFPPYQVGYLTC